MADLSWGKCVAIAEREAEALRTFAWPLRQEDHKRKGRQGFRKGAQSLSFPFSYRHTFTPAQVCHKP